MRRVSNIPGFNGKAKELKKIIEEMKKEPLKKVHG